MAEAFSIAGGCSLKAGKVERAAFREAFKGCDAVVHTAMPMDHSDLVYNSEEYNRLREELIAATEMVLEAAAAEGVYAFILTSSSTAVMGRVVDGRVYNEKDWSDEQEGTSAYGMLKAAVERAAVQWHTKYAEKHGSPFRLCRICPPAILGPSNAPTINEFVRQFITSPLNDTLKWSSIPEMRFHACTLKDAAFAHVLAVENESAIGRYCIGERAFTAMEWVRALHAAGYTWPTYAVLHLPVPGPSWLVNPTFRTLLSSQWIASLLGFGPDEVRGILSVLGVTKWAYDCSRAKRELGGPQRLFGHESVFEAGVAAARALEAQGRLVGIGGQVTREGSEWVPSPWESKYVRG